MRPGTILEVAGGGFAPWSTDVNLVSVGSYGWLIGAVPAWTPPSWTPTLSSVGSWSFWTSSVAAGLDSSMLDDARVAYIEVMSASCRAAFGTDPVMGINELGHLMYTGDVMILYSPAAIRSIRFVNYLDAEPALISATVDTRNL